MKSRTLIIALVLASALAVTAAPISSTTGLDQNTPWLEVLKKLDAGTAHLTGGLNVTNYSTTSQAVSAATRTYLAGSAIAIPASGLRVGTVLRWRLNVTKTAAGSAASTFDVAFGTAGTTADTATVSFTKPAGTAASDEGYIEIEVVIRGPLGASCIAVGEFQMTHNLAATGHATIPCVVVNTVSSAFASTTPTFAGLCLTSGASDAITVQQVTATGSNL